MYIFQPDRYLLKQQVKKYSHYIKGKVLDVGAGKFSRYRSLFACDKYIKMDVEKSNNIDVLGSAENIPFDNETFDSIVCTQVFEHLKVPNKAAREIHRVLKKDGYCLITVPQINELHEEPNDYFRYTNFGIAEIFQRNGFQLIKCDQRGGFFTAISQMQIRYLIDKFDLYKKSLISRIFSKLARLYGGLMIWLDKIDQSKANKKHALGWLFIFKK